MKIRKIINPINKLSILAILIYKKTKIRKYDKCLHYPSCSTYGILAFKKYGTITAIRKTYLRIRDCNPFSNREYIDYP
jgi:putative component of membrane protein insertase Oxa1/YidC/SpoIIIJ protein YidD